jgi:hypothetical protein
MLVIAPTFKSERARFAMAVLLAGADISTPLKKARPLHAAPPFY